MPRKRKSLQASDESILEESEQSGNVTMTQEALSTLLTTLQQSQAEFCNKLLREVRSSTPHVSSDASTCAVNAAMGVMRSTTANFSKCTSKFSGNSEESVENFIDAIEVYKSCLNISDANALLGMSMLLTSSAGTWWQGVKGTTKTWDEAITRLRSAYGDRRPPFRIYVELFSLVQGKENTDLFIAKVRALLAKLPQEDLCERVELDMAFGLLDRRIRKRIDRAEVSTFDELLKKARAVEDSLNESRAQRPSSGHEESSRAANVTAAEPPRATTSNYSSRSSTAAVGSRTGDSTTKKAGNTKSFCVYCKRNGHTKEKCEKLANSDKNNSKSEDSKDIKCYGCGAANVIKSKCAKCNGNTGKNSEHSAFYSLSSTRDHRTPTGRIKSSRSRPGRSDERTETSAPPPQTPTPPLRGSVMFAGKANASAPSCAESSSHKVGGNPAYVTGGSINNTSVYNLTTDNDNITMDTYYSDNSVPYSKCLHDQVTCNCNSQSYFNL